MRPTPVVPLSVRETLAGKRILLTGATGFLGKVWALMLLEACPEVAGLVALVRGRRGEDPVRRLEREWSVSPALRAWRDRHGRSAADDLAARLEVVPGDVGEPLAGVGEADLAALDGQIDLIVHFAGVTDFQPDPLQAVAVNTHGAVHVAELAARLGVPLLHVSTAYVAGRVDGRVPEVLDPRVAPSGATFDPQAELDALQAALDALPSTRATRQQRVDAAAERANALGWPNIYTYTKGLAERLLALRDDVEVTIVRPSIVECARAYPFEGWNEGLNTSAPLAWLISTAFRDFPSRAHHHFDIAPVDLVARGITLTAAAILAGHGGGVLHLGTSGSNPVHFGRIIELTGLANRRRLREDPSAGAFQRLVVSQLDPVAVDADRRPLWHVSRLRRGARLVKQVLERTRHTDLPGALDDLAGDRIARWRQRGLKQTNEALRNLARIEVMLDLYQPFVHDQDYVFENDRVRALSAGLPPEEREAFAWDDDTLDWRQYWYDVQYPGLWTWSIPILFGDRVPEDPPMSPSLRLRRVGEEAAALAEGAK